MKLVVRKLDLSPSGTRSGPMSTLLAFLGTLPSKRLVLAGHVGRLEGGFNGTILVPTTIQYPALVVSCYQFIHVVFRRIIRISSSYECSARQPADTDGKFRALGQSRARPVIDDIVYGRCLIGCKIKVAESWSFGGRSTSPFP
jgi:hypothetical protein